MVKLINQQQTLVKLLFAPNPDISRPLHLGEKLVQNGTNTNQDIKRCMEVADSCFMNICIPTLVNMIRNHGHVSPFMSLGGKAFVFMPHVSKNFDKTGVR